LAAASAKVFFSEDFSDGWENRWVESDWKKSEGSKGTFELSTVKFDTGAKGLMTKEDSRHFTISASFDSFSNKGKTLVVQYAANYQKEIECGGAYVKLGPKMADATAFGDPTVYNIMFGPDKCGYTKRTHLIFANNGKNHLKKSDLAYKQDHDGTTHLYRLVVKPDNTVTVSVNEKEVYSGSLKADWEILPPKEIDDPEDKKPSDWVNEPMMDDPEDKKPADWVEEAKIVDKSAKKPDDWDEEEDGEWEAPMIDNPDYKGAWKVKRIANPEYKGVWAPKKIANPNFKDDDELYAFDDFSFIGFDLWQVKGNTIFNHILIGDDVSEAVEAAKKVMELRDKELKMKEEATKKQAEESTKTEEAAKDSTADVEEEGEDENDL